MNQLHFGYTLSSEEHDPVSLVQNARLAEQAGFQFVGISDHFHPWSEDQGQSPFVFSVIGALSQVLEEIDVIVGVTCPIIRIHPAIVAQAAATCSLLLEGRFLLGIGAGENLNEHIVGMGWPPTAVRHEMLREAIAIIKILWTGEFTNYFGKYFTVEGAKLYSHPEEQLPLLVAASGAKAATLAGELGDGLISTGPEKKVIKQFEKSGGSGKPTFAQITVSYDQNEEKAKKIAHRYWRFTALPSPLSSDLRLPMDFDKASSILTPDQIAETIICGANIEDYINEVSKYVSAGFNNIYFHQVGPNQDGFLRFSENELLPGLKRRFGRKRVAPPSRQISPRINNRN